MNDILKFIHLGKLVDRKFQSGNEVPVERITITAKEVNEINNLTDGCISDVAECEHLKCSRSTDYEDFYDCKICGKTKSIFFEET